MEVFFDLVDWKIAQSKAVEGYFKDGLKEEEWIEELEETSVLGTEFLLGAACDAIIPRCQEEHRDALLSSLGRFMKEVSEQWNELPAKLDPELYWLALSPDTVASIYGQMEKIAYNELMQLYEMECPQKIKDDLEYSPNDFIEHLKMWHNVFRQAETSRRGLVVMVG